MTQLILNNTVYLPETSRDKYRCWPEQLGEQLDMISGRRVVEVRGTVWKIAYAYDYMGDLLMRQMLAVLRGKGSFPVTFLPDNSDFMRTSRFLTESLTNPGFAFSRNGVPYWHNIAFTLREVEPHD